MNQAEVYRSQVQLLIRLLPFGFLQNSCARIGQIATDQCGKSPGSAVEVAKYR
jgi:hypothetical protein